LQAHAFENIQGSFYYLDELLANTGITRSMNAEASIKLTMEDEAVTISTTSSGDVEYDINEVYFALEGEVEYKDSFFQDLIDGDDLFFNGDAEIAQYTDFSASVSDTPEEALLSSRMYVSTELDTDNTISVSAYADINSAAVIKYVDSEYVKTAVSFSLKEIDTKLTETEQGELADAFNDLNSATSEAEAEAAFEDICVILWGSYSESTEYLKLNITVSNNSVSNSKSFTNLEIANAFGL